jgi:hypothetical protein
VRLAIARTAATPVISDDRGDRQVGNHIKFTEEVDLFNVNSDSVALVDTLGANAGESLNLAMEGVWSAATNVRRAGGSADNTAISTAISVNDIKYVVNQLNRQSAMKFFSEPKAPHPSTRRRCASLISAFVTWTLRTSGR